MVPDGSWFLVMVFGGFSWFMIVFEYLSFMLILPGSLCFLMIFDGLYSFFVWFLMVFNSQYRDFYVSLCLTKKLLLIVSDGSLMALQTFRWFLMVFNGPGHICFSLIITLCLLMGLECYWGFLSFLFCALRVQMVLHR